MPCLTQAAPFYTCIPTSRSVPLSSLPMDTSDDTSTSPDTSGETSESCLETSISPSRSQRSTESQPRNAAATFSSPPAATAPRKPVPRKGHTKSRRGCFNCKRRRIKCNEKHPNCAHCEKASLNCEWPVNFVQTPTTNATTTIAQQSEWSQLPTPQKMVHLGSTPGVFVSFSLFYFLMLECHASISMLHLLSYVFPAIVSVFLRTKADQEPNQRLEDMRLFHHFLITAYPHLPVGADKIWITIIPSFAHNVSSTPLHSSGASRCSRLHYARQPV